MAAAKILIAAVSCTTSFMLVRIIPDLLSGKTRELFLKKKVVDLDREMGIGGRGEDRDGEGVMMAEDFFWSCIDEPHASRRRQILSKYPQIKELFGPDYSALFKISVVVLLQLSTAISFKDAGWLKILLVSYFFGSFLNHNLFLAIHELSHNLAFSSPVCNRWLGIFANLPIGVPLSVTFQKYHLEHHRFQGVDGVDMDVPSLTEARFVTNVLAKTIWVFLQLFFYAFRPLFLKPKPPGLWEFMNFSIQIALDVSMVYFWGWKSLGLSHTCHSCWWRNGSDGENKTLWIGDLYNWMDENYLHRCCAPTGEINSIKVIRNKHSGY